jgi:hypothetical protein
VEIVHHSYQNPFLKKGLQRRKDGKEERMATKKGCQRRKDGKEERMQKKTLTLQVKAPRACRRCPTLIHAIAGESGICMIWGTHTFNDPNQVIGVLAEVPGCSIVASGGSQEDPPCRILNDYPYSLHRAEELVAISSV